MKLLLPFVLLASLPLSASSSGVYPRTYLASIVGVPLKTGESLKAFSITTWGVTYRAVCKFPSGWRIKAGRSLTPGGTLEGEGSQGITWFNQRSPSELQYFVLIELFNDVQRADVAEGTDATFKGQATISTDDGERIAPLTYENVELTLASRCPQTTGSF